MLIFAKSFNLQPPIAIKLMYVLLKYVAEMISNEDLENTQIHLFLNLFSRELENL